MTKRSDQAARTALATERAEAYAPRPTGGSLMAGVCGAVVALLGDVAVSTFYGWRAREHLLLAAAVSAAGFVVVFLGYKRKAQLSRHARRAELAKLERDAGPPTTP